MRDGLVRTVWAETAKGRRLYLVDGECEFVRPVKQYLDYLDAIEKSPNTLESYCRHEQAKLDWMAVSPQDLVTFVQWLRNPVRRVGVVPMTGTSPLSERTVNTIVTAVASFYRYQIQRGEPI